MKMKKDSCPKCNSKKVKIKEVSGVILSISCPVCGYLWDSSKKACFVDFI